MDEGIEVIGTHNHATVDRVDEAIRQRYLDLVEEANPEDLAKLLDSWSKYIAARKNSDVFEREETAEERIEREAQAAIAKAMGGEA